MAEKVTKIENPFLPQTEFKSPPNVCEVDVKEGYSKEELEIGTITD